MLLKRDPANPAPAEEAFLAAIAVAKRQATRSFELRAALSLAKLYQATGRPAEAHAILAPALEGFSPTPEMPEIAEAQALLAALAETEEVKAAVAQRKRRLHLQTAYGHAMMWATGFASEETKAAFARATELAAGSDHSLERLVAAHGQWVLATVRGELRATRGASIDVPSGSGGGRPRHGSLRRSPQPCLDLLLFRGFRRGGVPLRAGARRLRPRVGHGGAGTFWRRHQRCSDVLPCLDGLAIRGRRTRARID